MCDAHSSAPGSDLRGLGQEAGHPLTNISETGEFVLNLAGVGMQDKVTPTARYSAPDADEFVEARELLEKPLDKLFTVKPVRVSVPEKAVIEPSVACDQCREPTMRSRLIEINGRHLCRDCAGL